MNPRPFWMKPPPPPVPEQSPRQKKTLALAERELLREMRRIARRRDKARRKRHPSKLFADTRRDLGRLRALLSAAANRLDE